jgi:O-antigen ligase
LVLGLGLFAVRFQQYFATGATSASARLDYWRAAVQTVTDKPIFGSGPGTFQRPYSELKSPESEMARLAHNDYLEQFSDSGVVGGLAYLGWIGLALGFVGRKVWTRPNPIYLGVYAGLMAWFLQGLGEFSLYIPALAWTAFTLLGLLIGQKIKEFDK